MINKYYKTEVGNLGSIAKCHSLNEYAEEKRHCLNTEKVYTF